MEDLCLFINMRIRFILEVKGVFSFFSVAHSVRSVAPIPMRVHALNQNKIKQGYSGGSRRTFELEFIPEHEEPPAPEMSLQKKHMMTILSNP